MLKGLGRQLLSLTRAQVGVGCLALCFLCSTLSLVGPPLCLLRPPPRLLFLLPLLFIRQCLFRHGFAARQLSGRPFLTDDQHKLSELTGQAGCLSI